MFFHCFFYKLPTWRIKLYKTIIKVVACIYTLFSLLKLRQVVNFITPTQAYSGWFPDGLPRLIAERTHFESTIVHVRTIIHYHGERETTKLLANPGGARGFDVRRHATHVSDDDVGYYFPSPEVGTNWPFCVDVPLNNQQTNQPT